MNRQAVFTFCAATLAGALLLTLAGCATDPAESYAGPGVENPAGAPPNSITPAIGTAGNGGGVSGGAAGAAVSH